MTLQDEAVELLQRLLRLNTVNPPGNETIAAELLRDYLEANGVEVELYGRVPERMNLVARLRGGDGPSLCFLSHTDTVVAAPDEWSRDPWSGDLADDHVWGRGALDMKNQVAASAVAIASLAREGFVRPAISSSSRRPTRRSARTTASSGSASTIRTLFASTTRSTRAAASGSSSAAAPSTSARPRRR